MAGFDSRQKLRRGRAQVDPSHALGATCSLSPFLHSRCSRLGFPCSRSFLSLRIPESCPRAPSMAGRSSRLSLSYDDALSLYSEWLVAGHSPKLPSTEEEEKEEAPPRRNSTQALSDQPKGSTTTAENLRRKRKSDSRASPSWTARLQQQQQQQPAASNRASIGLGLGMQLDEEDRGPDPSSLGLVVPKAAASSTTARQRVAPRYTQHAVSSSAATLAPPPSAPLPALPRANASPNPNANPYLMVHLSSAEPLSPSVASHHPGSSLIHQADSFPSLIDHVGAGASGAAGTFTRQRMKTNDTTASTTGEKSPGFGGVLMESFPSPPRRQGTTPPSPKTTHLDVLPAPPHKLIAINRNENDVSSPSSKDESPRHRLSPRSPRLHDRSPNGPKRDDGDSDDDVCLAYLAERKKSIAKAHQDSGKRVTEAKTTTVDRENATRGHLKLDPEETKMLLGAGSSPARPSNRGPDRVGRSRTPTSPQYNSGQAHKPLPSLPLPDAYTTEVPLQVTSENIVQAPTFAVQSLKQLRAAGELHAWTVGMDGAGCPRITPRPSAFHDPKCHFAGHPVVSTRLCGCRAMYARTQDDNAAVLVSRAAWEPSSTSQAPNLGHNLRASASAPDLLELGGKEEVQKHKGRPTLEDGDTENAIERQLTERKHRLEAQKQELSKLSKLIARMSQDVRNHRALAEVRDQLKQEHQRSLAPPQASIQVPVRGSSHWWPVDDKEVDAVSGDALNNDPRSQPFVGHQTPALAINNAHKKTSTLSAPIVHFETQSPVQRSSTKSPDPPPTPKKEPNAIAKWAKKMPSASSLAASSSLKIKVPLRRMGSMDQLSAPSLRSPVSPLLSPRWKNKPLPSPIACHPSSPLSPPPVQRTPLPASPQSPTRKPFARISTVRSQSREDKPAYETADGGQRFANMDAVQSRFASEGTSSSGTSSSKVAVPTTLKNQVTGTHPPSTRNTRPNQQQYFKSPSPTPSLSSPPRTPRTPPRKAKRVPATTGRHTPSASYSSSASSSSMSTSSSNNHSSPFASSSASTSPRSVPRVIRGRGDSISTIATTVLDEEEELEDAYKKLVEDQRAASAMVSSVSALFSLHPLLI